MSQFLEPLKVELVDDGDMWRVLEPMDYDIGEVGGEKIEEADEHDPVGPDDGRIPGAGLPRISDQVPPR